MLLTPINNILEKQSFLLGKKLTVADIAVGSYIYYAEKLLDMDYQDYPNLVKYMDVLTEMPSFIETLGKRFQERSQ